MKRHLVPKILLVFACTVLLPLLIAPLNLLASEKLSADHKISLTAKEEALGEVLKQVARKYGYRITISPEYANIPISTSFQNLTLHEAIRRILGKLDRFVLIDEADRVIQLGCVGNTAANGVEPFARHSAKYDALDLEVVPPDESGSPSMTLGEIKTLKKSRPYQNPGDVEIVPPEYPGQKGITLKEIKKKKYDPNEQEIVPPDNPGEKGITFNEISALKGQQN